MESYKKGYADGMNDSCNQSNANAYYVGVGYGKKLSGDKNVGFNSDSERESFERGISHKDKHFNSYRAEPLSFWEKLFGKKPKNVVKYKDPKKHKRNVLNRAKRIRRSRKKSRYSKKRSR